MARADDKPEETSETPERVGAASKYIPEVGERLMSFGQTGSGKTTGMVHLLDRLPDDAYPAVIYDTKHDPKFDALPNNRVVDNMGDAQDAIDDLGADFVIVRPPPVVTAQPAILDRFLQYHEENWHGVTAYIDELYHFHKNAYAGPGLNGLYTRGRSRGITTIGSSQRPAWVSGFLFSESQLFYVFRLAMLKDRKKVGDFIPGFDALPVPKGHSFYVVRQGDDEAPKLHAAIPVDDKTRMGYTDHLKRPEAADSTVDDRPKKSRIVWF